jgi:hypothetical protein
MKFTILINQQAIVESKLPIDVTDAIILNYFSDFIYTGKMKTVCENGESFYWVSYSEIMKQLPILGVTNRDAIYRRFKKFVDLKLVIPHPGNRRMNSSFYKLTPLFGTLMFGDTPGVKTEPPVLEPDTPGVSTGQPPVQTPMDYTISDKTIKDKEEKIKNSKIKFCKQVIVWATKNPDKYPKLMYFEFAKHWLELAQSEKSLRYEDEKFFEIGKRLATWFSFSDNKKLSDQWSAEKQTETINSLLRKLL